MRKSIAIFSLAIALIYNIGILRVEAEELVIVPPDLLPLNQLAVPEPPNLFQFVKNKNAAIRLGKAFFWDMQVGSDGIQACASCHFHAGADNRRKNTINPGFKAGDTIFGNNSTGAAGFPGFGPNYTLQEADFPFHQRQEPADLQSSAVIRDTNDVVGSQGVRFAQFVDIVAGSAIDNTQPIADPVFNFGGINTRRVTGRNTPSVINAIFNFTNFWDGRAHFIFNGENPFGPADRNAGVWFKDAVEGLVKRAVAIEFASLASQATGPALDDTEMSASGRTFPKLGRKMLSLTPLGKQLVHPNDSVIGVLSQAEILPDGKIRSLNGLKTSYSQMIKDAFRNELWDSTEFTPGGFTQMEANFALFWGLAIQLYEATLVSDQTPFDRFLGGDTLALTEEQKFGFALFSGIGNCTACHAGSEFTNASHTSIAFVNNADNGALEIMFVSSGSQVIYDNGFNNTAVTQTTDDIARGGTAPFINTLTNEQYPLSFSRLAELQAQALLPFSSPILPIFVPSNFPVNVNGSFKVPGLRNVELTAPYFHNGSIMTLDDMVDFYVRGGNFPMANISDLDPVIGEGLSLIQGDEAKHTALVAFMKSLTDERVKNESAPFDHPEILVPNGDPEVLLRIPARDANGDLASTTLITVNAVATPTHITTQTLSGTVEAGLIPEVVVDTSANVGPVIVNGTDWSVEISGLTVGDNVVRVSVIDSAGVMNELTATIHVVLNDPPGIISPAVITATVGQPYRYDATATDPNNDILTFSLVTAPDGMAIDAVTGVITWTPTPLQAGPQNITVRVTDAGGLSAQQSFTITVASGFSISGRVVDFRSRLPISGVTITLAGPVNRTALTDASGNYSFPGLSNGRYTLTPSRAGFRISPLRRIIVIRGTNSRVNFLGMQR